MRIFRQLDPRFVLLLLASAVYLIPIVLLVLGSLKGAEELSRNPHNLLPESFVFSNYLEAFAAVDVFRFLSNSLFLCVFSVVGTLISCSMAAYGLSHIRWRGQNFVFVLVVASLLIPWQVTMLPKFAVISSLGLYDSLWAIVLPRFLGDAFFIFLLRQYFLMIPREILEAGRMDGLSEFSIYWRIVLPISAPGLVAVGLFQWISSWNDFQEPLLFLSDPDKFPLAYGLERFVSSYSDQTHLLLAASVMFCLPIFVLFMLTQRYFWSISRLGGVEKG